MGVKETIKKYESYLRKDDYIHLTEEGIKACAEQVANAIKEVAKTL